MSSLVVSSNNGEEGCVIHIMGYNVIAVACVSRLLAWFVGAGRAGFVFRSLLSFTGGRGEVFMDCCVIGALLG